jgi:hypothetical protein
MNNHQDQPIQNWLPGCWKTVQLINTPFRYNLIDGIIYSPLITQQRLDELKLSFKTRSNDIFLSTYMKSGTLWTMQIIRLITLRGADSTDGTNLFEFCPGLEETPNNAFLEEYPSPRYMHTHLPHHIIVKSINKEQPCKYIYIVRNPRDVAVSMYNHIVTRTMYQSNISWEEFLKYFMAGKVPCGSWYDHVLGWWKYRNYPNVLFLKYEDRLTNPHSDVCQIADFIGIQLTEEEVEAVVKKSRFDQMKTNQFVNGSWLKRDPDSVGHLRKGKIGDWMNYFTDEQLSDFNQQYDKNMRGTGLEFDFF